MKWSAKLLFGLGLVPLPIADANKVDTNRKLGESYISALNNKQYDSLLGFFTSPNATYWTNGDPARTSDAGNRTVAERMRDIPILFGRFDRFSLTLTGIAAEEDVVMLEALARGEGPGTFLYVQTAVMSMRVKGGKFDSLREYLDHQEIEYLAAYLERWPQVRPGAS